MRSGKSEPTQVTPAAAKKPTSEASLAAPPSSGPAKSPRITKGSNTRMGIHVTRSAAAEVSIPAKRSSAAESRVNTAAASAEEDDAFTKNSNTTQGIHRTAPRKPKSKSQTKADSKK